MFCQDHPTEQALRNKKSIRRLKSDLEDDIGIRSRPRTNHTAAGSDDYSHWHLLQISFVAQVDHIDCSCVVEGS
jgi:hypothetical protein